MTGHSIFLIGESDHGKSHYGGQLLSRLMKSDGEIRMRGMADNIEPFQNVLDRLSVGLAADHTATATYSTSVWPIVDAAGREAELIWPEYGGEQIKNIVSYRRLPSVWMQRAQNSSDWLFLIRLQKFSHANDIFRRPVAELTGATEDNKPVEISDQARLIELLQILLYARHADHKEQLATPNLMILLTCWDELKTTERPQPLLAKHLPMFSEFVTTNFTNLRVLGLSAVGKELSRSIRDESYAALGPDRFGEVILEDGSKSQDLTLPIKLLLADAI